MLKDMPCMLLAAMGKHRPAPEHKVDHEIVLEAVVHRKVEADVVHASSEHKVDREVVLEAVVQRKVEADAVHAA